MSSGASGAAATKADVDTDLRQAAWEVVSRLGCTSNREYRTRTYICRAAIEGSGEGSSDSISNGWSSKLRTSP